MSSVRTAGVLTDLNQSLKEYGVKDCHCASSFDGAVVLESHPVKRSLIEPYLTN